MKTISKSKHKLAQLLIEAGVTQFPEGANWAAQCKRDVAISFYRDKPYRDDDCWWGDHLDCCDVSIGVLIPNWHQTELGRDEFDQIVAETVVQGEPDADGWIEWLRDKLPVAKGTIIDVKYSDGDELYAAPCGVFTTSMTSIRGECASAELFGRGDGSFIHIIAYRLHKHGEAEPQYCESVTRSIPKPDLSNKNNSITQLDDIGVVELKPTLDQLLQCWRNADDYAQRKQAEADEAASMRDERWQAVLARAIEMGVTVERYESAVVAEPELVVADWRDLRLGDIVEVTWSGNGAWVKIEGKEVTVVKTGESENDLLLRSGDGHEWFASGNTRWRFIRRP